MEQQLIENNVRALVSEIPARNPYGEKVTLVAAVKYQPTELINRAISAGITDIGDNHPQEFRDKYADIVGNPKRHFIGHLQANKIKYLLGRCDLYQSIDRLSIAEELSKKSLAAGLTSDVLIQINIGEESTKGGFAPTAAEEAYRAVSTLNALKIRGFMAMLPLDASENTLISLAKHMRGIYDSVRAYAADVTCLSMGMSGDWHICVEAGSNMIRLGTSIFGARQYAAK